MLPCLTSVQYSAYLGPVFCKEPLRRVFSYGKILSPHAAWSYFVFDGMSQRSCQVGASLPVGDLADLFQLQTTDDEVRDGDDVLLVSESSSDENSTDNEEALPVGEDSDDATL